MKLCVIGLGYVGITTAVCMAENGHDVLGIDKDDGKLNLLSRSVSPIYEPDLEELLKKNHNEGRLKFSNSIKEGISTAKIIFICVNTPSNNDGSVDVSEILNVSRKIAQYMNQTKVIVIKSTVPVGFSQRVAQLISENMVNQCDFSIVHNPEFLREGRAVYDSLHPDRIILGTDSEFAFEMLKEVYKKIKAPILFTDTYNSEMIKYVANCFLAIKISYINSISRLCEKCGCDIDVIAKAIGMDPRIGSSFLKAGLGYGGSCLPKDTTALLKFSEEMECELGLIRLCTEINMNQIVYFFDKIKSYFGNLRGKNIAIFGVAFKAGTDDIRNSPGVSIIKMLIENDVIVHCWDRLAMSSIKEFMNAIDKKVFCCDSPYEAAKGADGVVVTTEENMFIDIDWNIIGKLLKHKAIFDGRNILSRNELEELGFHYSGIGR